MRRIAIVAWTSFRLAVFQPSFAVSLFLPPLMIGAGWLYFQFIGWMSGLELTPSKLPAPGIVISSNVAPNKPMAYVDQASLLTDFPDDFTPDQLLVYPDEAAARVATTSGEIAGYYLIPRDFIATGVITFYSPENVQYVETDSLIKKLIIFNLALADGEAVARRVADGPTFTSRVINLPEKPGGIGSFSLGHLMLAMYIFTVATTITSTAGTLLAANIARDRYGRVLETVFGAISPMQLLAGKFIGLVTVSLIEMLAWVGWVGGFSRRVIPPTDPATFTASFLRDRALGFDQFANMFIATGQPLRQATFTDYAAAVLSLFGSYLAYAATSAIFAAYARDGERASRIRGVMTLIGYIPLAFVGLLLRDAHGAVAVALSIFPLFAPTAMITRIFIGGGVPSWQIAAGLAASLAWTWLMLKWSIRVFNAHSLLDPRPLHSVVWQWLKRAVLGKLDQKNRATR